MSDPSLSRRGFLAAGAASAAVPALGLQGSTQERAADIDAQTLAEAQKVFGLEFTQEEREQMVQRLSRRANGLPALRENRSLPNGVSSLALLQSVSPGKSMSPSKSLSSPSAQSGVSERS